MMLDVHHFSYGWLTPILSYATSFTGCLLGLQCAARGRHSLAHRWSWLAAAAVAIGGTGVWVMHFIAMLGFSIQGTSIRYDIPLTVLSAVVAIVTVGIGLSLMAQPQPSVPAMLGSGAITGLGVAGMHYIGMAAMNSTADIDYDTALVTASVLIAIIGVVTMLLPAAVGITPQAGPAARGGDRSGGQAATEPGRIGTSGSSPR